MIVQAGWGNTKSALYELADAGMEEEAREGAEKAAIAVLEGRKEEIRGVQGIKSGQNLMFEVEVAVPADCSVAESNEIEVEIRAAIAANVRGTKRVNVRFTTKEETAFIDQFVASDEKLDGESDGHDHDHTHHDHGHSNGTSHKEK
jgi:divalent metal cation (Fe/Co/Zn/Cd) transporter